MSEIYVYLVNQMHVALNEAFDQQSPAIESNTTELEVLKEFADIAEWNQQTDICIKYHQERIAKFEENINAWFDYCCACLRNGRTEIGEEGLREIISRKPKHVKSLLAHSFICLAKENYEEAKVFIKEALHVEPNGITTNAIMGVYHEIVSEEGEAEKYYKKVKELGLQHGIARVYLQVTEFAVSINNSLVADKFLAQDMILNGMDTKPYLVLFQLELQKGNHKKAEDTLKDALKIDSTDPTVWNAIGHLNYITGKFGEARVAYENVLSNAHSNPSFPLDLVYIRLGSIALQEFKQNQKDTMSGQIAKAMFLKASTLKPSCQSWLGVGKACFFLAEYDEAEDALAEANILNNRDSEVWLYLSLVSLALQRKVEANRTLAQSMRLGIKDNSLLRLVGLTRLAANKFLDSKEVAPAAELFRLVLEANPDDLDAKECFTKCLGNTTDAPALPALSV